MARGQGVGQGRGKLEKPFQFREDGVVAAQMASLFAGHRVPQPEAHPETGFTRSAADKGEHPGKIALKRRAGLLLFKAVQGDVDLAEGGACQQQLPRAGQEGAVGGEVHPQPLVCAEGEQRAKIGMEEGLAQHVEGEMVGVGPHPGENLGKEGRRHEPLGPGASVAEAAGEVTAVGDLDVDLLER